jgi:hypothetical protein
MPKARRIAEAAPMWTGVAISAIWLAVAISALWGADIVAVDVSGSHTTIPSGVVVALFGSLATWVLARHGFPHQDS